MMDLAHLLLRAHESVFGIAVATNKVKLLRNQLYAERRKWPEFSGLSIIPCPTNPDASLWLVKKEAKNG